MKPGITISCVAHVGVLLWSVVAFSAKPMSTPPAEALPVDFITAKQFSEMTAGVKNAPKLEKPKPLADKIDAPQPAKQAAPKVEDKPDITTDAAVKKPPTPEPKPPEKAEKKKVPEPKVDDIAQELKKEDAKKPPKPEDKPVPKKPSPKFDANQVAALLDKRDPRRKLAAAEALNNSPSLGTAAGSAAKLSQSEIDALRAVSTSAGTRLRLRLRRIRPSSTSCCACSSGPTGRSRAIHRSSKVRRRHWGRSLPRVPSAHC